jgi:transposase
MSDLTIAPYFPFRRIKIVNQSVDFDAAKASIEILPHKRFKPVCHRCGHKADTVHSWAKRRVRDLNLATAKVWLDCHYRKLYCPVCQRIIVEDLELFDPYIRVTRRLAYYVYQLCQVMTVTEVANHLDLDWKTVKAIDKKFLEQRYDELDLNGLRILAVDEIAVRRGHQYLTVVLDYLSGRIIFVGKDRKADTLISFFEQMSPRQRQNIEAVAMDMWDPFIKAVKKLPKAKIVFDLFHVVAAFSRVIDKVRNIEYQRASKDNKTVFKGARYLLLKNRSNLHRQSQRDQLKELLELNETLNTVMILKDKLKHIWQYRHRTWANKAINQWCQLARSVKQPALTAFAKMLERHRYGIVNHCDYPIHTGKIEGVNNKIKVIKRKAYGFHDLRYFTLKIYQAFSN